MRILLVHPPYVGNNDIYYVPLGLAYIAAIAERAGHYVKVLDLHNMHLPFSMLDRELRRGDYSLVMSGGFAMQVKGMQETTRRVRANAPQIPVLLGGVGVSDIPEIALNYTGANAVAIGESESILPDLLGSIEAGAPFEGTTGVVYRNGSRIVKRPRAPAPEDLDALPYPAYHLFDVERIAPRCYNGWGAKKSIHVMTSRGCPFRCTFCINSVLNSPKLLKQIHGELMDERVMKPQRFRSPESMVAEIEYLRRRFDIQDFHFADEEFISDRHHVFRMCHALKPLGISWSTSGRADWASDEKLRVMKDAGCRYVIFGIESGSQHMLDLMKKNAKKHRNVEGIQNARRVGLPIISNFMIGHPGETRETIIESAQFCKENGLKYLPSHVVLFPNSAMFHQLISRIGSWDDYFERLSRIDFTRNLFMNLTSISTPELLRLRDWAVSETYFEQSKHLSENVLRILRWLVRLRILGPFGRLPRLEQGLRNLHGAYANSRWARQPRMFQIPPNSAGQRVMRSTDGYDDSLADLRREHAQER